MAESKEQVADAIVSARDSLEQALCLRWSASTCLTLVRSPSLRMPSTTI